MKSLRTCTKSIDRLEVLGKSFGTVTSEGGQKRPYGGERRAAKAGKAQYYHAMAPHPP